jgi:hypothetical protein
LIQYGDLWRAGANQATTITSDTEFKIGDQTIPAGEYALFIIPNESEWIFILNKNNGTWGATGYDNLLDVARISVPVNNSDFRETLTIEISNVTDKALGITVLLENKSATLPITVEYHKQAIVNITAELNSINDLYKKYNAIATYYLENDSQPIKALEYAKKSCELDAKVFNIKALSLAYAANGE